MRVMRAVEGPENVVWHAMERDDTAVCGETLPPSAGWGTVRGETLCTACMAEIERATHPIAAPPSNP